MLRWFKKQDALSRFERSLLSNVERHGCHINYVGDADEAASPAWAYSVGFTKSLGQGEVICTGMKLDAAHWFINTVFDRCKNDGFVLVDGAQMEVRPDCSLIVRQIPVDRISDEWFNSANWFHRRTFGTCLTEAYQLVWPSGKDGCYPWDERCEDDFRKLQPVLFETRLN